jgi:hypothetical protein
VRRLVSSLGILIVVAMLAGFFWFSIAISKPVEGTLQEDLVTGTVRPAPALAPKGPFLAYVALYAGAASERRPLYPVDDEQPRDDGAFALSADGLDGRRFWLLARIETAQEELFCATIPLPEMRVGERGEWVVTATGRPLEPRAIVVDASTPCDWY